MTPFAGVLVFAVTHAFARATLPIAGAVGVLGFVSLLAAQRLIHQKDEAAFLGFHREQLGLQARHEAHLAQILASQESANLRSMPRFGPHRAGCLHGAHASEMQAKRRHATNRQTEDGRLQPHGLEKPLDPWKSILHNHGRDSFSVGDNLALTGLNTDLTRGVSFYFQT